MNHINNNNNNTTEMKGGFRYFEEKPKTKKHISFDKLVKETKKSEGKLISSYEEMDKKSQDYVKSYKDHIENLEVLDDYAHFNGLTTLFQQVIMKDNIKTGKIDTSIPIFFRNYMIEGEVSPNVLREEHLKRQIDYLTDKYFSLTDKALINYVSIVDVTKSSFVFNVIMIDNKKYNRKIHHDDFIVDKNELKKNMKDIIHTSKKNLRRDNKILLDNRNTEPTYSSRSKSIPNSRRRKSSRSRKSSRGRSRSSRSRRSSKKHSRKSSSKKNNQNIDMFASNSQKGLSKLNNAVKNIIKSKKKSISPFSVNKTKSMVFKEAKDKKNAENKAKAPPITKEQIIDSKCKLYGENAEMCKADTDCYFSINANKCLKGDNTKKPPVAGLPPTGLPVGLQGLNFGQGMGTNPLDKQVL